MDEGERWMEGEDAAEEELRLLEAMAGVSTAMQQVGQNTLAVAMIQLPLGINN